MFAGSIGGGGWVEVVQGAVRTGEMRGDFADGRGGWWCVEYGKDEIHFLLKLFCLGLSITTTFAVYDGIRR